MPLATLQQHEFSIRSNPARDPVLAGHRAVVPAEKGREAIFSPVSRRKNGVFCCMLVALVVAQFGALMRTCIVSDLSRPIFAPCFAPRAIFAADFDLPPSRSN